MLSIAPREGPRKPGKREPLIYVVILINVAVVVEIDELMCGGLNEYHCHGHDQERANCHVDGDREYWAPERREAWCDVCVGATPPADGFSTAAGASELVDPEYWLPRRFFPALFPIQHADYITVIVKTFSV